MLFFNECHPWPLCMTTPGGARADVFYVLKSVMVLSLAVEKIPTLFFPMECSFKVCDLLTKPGWRVECHQMTPFSLLQIACHVSTIQPPTYHIFSVQCVSRQVYLYSVNLASINIYRQRSQCRRFK